MSELYVSAEEQFVKDSNEILPKIERMLNTLKSNHQFLTNQRFQMESNQQTLNQQRAEIAANKEVLDNRSKQVEEKVKRAEDRCKEIEQGLVERTAAINHRDKESKKMREEAEKVLWKAKNQKLVEA